MHLDIVNAAKRNDVVMHQSPTLSIARVMEFDRNPRKTGENRCPHFEKKPSNPIEIMNIMYIPVIVFFCVCLHAFCVIMGV